YRFNDAALALYQFIWHEYCDWYVELSKIALSDARTKPIGQAVLVHILEHALRLLHPFMPFITEEIWQTLPVLKAADSIMIAPYPVADEARRDLVAETTMNQLIEAVRSVRNIRSDLGIGPTVPLSIRVAADGHRDHVEALALYIKALARVTTVELLDASERPGGEPSALVEGFGEIFVPLRGVVDAVEVRKRLERDLSKVAKELSAVTAKLSRADFIDRAPKDIVDKERQRSESLRGREATLRRHLAVLSEQQPPS